MMSLVVSSWLVYCGGSGRTRGVFPVSWSSRDGSQEASGITRICFFYCWHARLLLRFIASSQSITSNHEQSQDQGLFVLTTSR